jgi:hypothetical protein
MKKVFFLEITIIMVLTVSSCNQAGAQGNQTGQSNTLGSLGASNG